MFVVAENRFITVWYGVKMTSSWSCPKSPEPFAFKTPMTLSGMLL